MSVSDKLIGRVLGDFRLDDLIGRGSAGRVYRATQLSLNRPVAVKVLEEGLFTLEELKERFLREAEFIAKLEHPNIVPVYAAGHLDNLYFFAMRWVDGPTLDELLRKGLPLRDGLRYLADVAAALAYAHSRAIVHRDVKPANIIVADGAAVLADFGLARLLDRTTITMSGSPLGTPLYLSPEHALGQRATFAGDLFALGVIAYELAVGRSPWEPAQSRDQLLPQIAQGDFPPPRSVRPELPPPLEDLILRAMKLDPKERFSSARELQLALLSLLSHPDLGPAPVPEKTPSFVVVEPSSPRPRVPASPCLPEGKPFGKYRLLNRLGKGGMGVVFRALDTELGRTVALKALLDQDADDDNLLRRFQREARSAARLRHPNIVPIHEIGQVDSKHYFTMDLVDGTDLDAMLDPGPLPPKRACEILRDAARAVQYAHDQGIVHRDIKPSNILVDKSGRVLLTDFGLAKDLSLAQTKLTMSGELLGTPAYMAPEQVRGRQTSIGPEADVYGLGAVLYHMIAGHAPFDSKESANLFIEILNAEPASPRATNPRIHPDVETICLKAMEKSPARRYVSAAALADDCERFLRGEPLAAKPVGFGTRLIRKLARHKTVALLSAAAAFSALALVGWILVTTIRTSARVRHQLDVAARLESEGRLLEARDALKSVAEIDPNRCRERLARVEGRLREAAEAENEAHRTLEAARAPLDAAARYLYDPEASYAELQRRVQQVQSPLDLAVAKAPHLPLGHYLLGRSWEILGREAEAERCWEEAIRRDPRFRPARFRLARLRLVQGYLAIVGIIDPNRTEGNTENTSAREALTRRIDQASAELAHATSEGPVFDEEADLREFLHVLVSYHAGTPASARSRAVERTQRAPREGKEDFFWFLGMTARGAEAVRLYDAALEICPKHWLSLFGRGLEYIGLKEYERAMRDCDAAAGIRPTFLGAYLNRGVANMYLGRTEEAAADFAKVLEMDPTCAAAYYNRGELRLRNSDPDGAIACFSESLRLGIQLPRRAYFQRAEAWSRKREWSRAIDDYGEVIRLDPQGSSGYHNRARMRINVQDLDGALADCNEALRLDLRLVEAYITRAYLHTKRGDWNAALADADAALAIDPNHEPAHYNRGLARHRLGLYAEAVSDFTDCLRLRPDHLEALLSRSASRFKLKDYDGAIADCDEALRMRPGYVDALTNRATFRTAKDDREGAIRDLEEALRLAPPDWPNRERTERLLKELKE